MKVGIYSPVDPLPSLVGNGYIIYLTTDSDAAKWNYNCNRNSHGISWIFPIAVLLLWTVPEETLLGSFHWWSNEEIPILTLRVRSFYMERDRSKEQQSENHLFFLCELVC
jgi:hypothetical protein